MKLSQINQLPSQVHLPTSKSLANRWLVLSALYPGQVEVNVNSSSDDIEILKSGLAQNQEDINVGHAGTAMRFLTAFLSIQPEKSFLVHGSPRMHERPIEPLVASLKKLGASINYLEKAGFPPLKIMGREIKGGTLEIDASMSSQYISALMLIAPKLKGGLQLKLKGTVVSRSYINLTAAVLRKAGVAAIFEGQTILISETQDLPEPLVISVEADWSAAAFWFGWVALIPGAAINLMGLSSQSTQGDRKLINYYEGLGVRTKEIEGGLRIYRVDIVLPEHLEINLINQPDLAQALAVTSAILGVEVKLNRLQTLVIKETNRLLALKKELANFGITAEITEDSIFIPAQKVVAPKRVIQTYNDHRMAMSFSLFASRFAVEIEAPEVVSKSYPKYFRDLLEDRAT